jgi:DNA-binding NarL/FixJ family response regulator
MARDRWTGGLSGGLLLTVMPSLGELRPSEADRAELDLIVAVVESRAFLRECISRCLQSALSVPCLTYSTLSELETELRYGCIQLVILSLMDVTAQACAHVLQELSEFALSRHVIVFAPSDDPQLALAALRSGAKAFVPVTMGFEIAVEVMRFVLAGGVYVPPDCLLTQAPARPSTPATSLGPHGLTPRELEVVRAIQQGKSNKVIAYEFNISLSTVKIHVRSIMKKTRANNRTHIAMKAQG